MQSFYPTGTSVYDKLGPETKTIGDMAGNVFRHRSGPFKRPTGEPFIRLVTPTKGRNGIPGARRGSWMTHAAYGVDLAGNWWYVRYHEQQGHASAHRVKAPNYSRIPRRPAPMGARKRSQWGALRDMVDAAIRDLAAARNTWQSQQDAAHIEQLRQRCPLV